MENQRQKFVLISFLAGAALFGYLILILLFQAAGTFDLEARIPHFDLVVRGISVFSGLVLYIYFYKSERVNQFMNEVVAELARVTWPTQKETSNATVVVLIMVTISGVFLGGMDALWTWLLRWIL